MVALQIGNTMKRLMTKSHRLVGDNKLPTNPSLLNMTDMFSASNITFENIINDFDVYYDNVLALLYTASFHRKIEHRTSLQLQKHIDVALLLSMLMSNDHLELLLAEVERVKAILQPEPYELGGFTNSGTNITGLYLGNIIGSSEDNLDILYPYIERNGNLGYVLHKMLEGDFELLEACISQLNHRCLMHGIIANKTYPHLNTLYVEEYIKRMKSERLYNPTLRRVVVEDLTDDQHRAGINEVMKILKMVYNTDTKLFKHLDSTMDFLTLIND